MPETTQQISPQRLMELSWGFAPPLILNAAVQHKVFDELSGNPADLEELAKRTGVAPRPLRAVCNALVGLQFLTREDDRYANAPEAEAFLVRGRPGFRGAFLFHLMHQVLGHWTQLSDTMRTGRAPAPVNQEHVGGEFFRAFVEALYPMNAPAAKALAEHLRIEERGERAKVLDVAAGSGVWGIAFAERSQKVQVTAVDWPEVIPATQNVVKQHKLTDRYRFIEGDINAVDFGEEFQVALLGHILHSEGEITSKKLLAKVGACLAPGGTVAIGEFLVDPDRRGPVSALLFAVNMVMHTERGDTFSVPEISSWLENAGFRNIRTLEIPGPSPLILADR